MQKNRGFVSFLIVIIVLAVIGFAWSAWRAGKNPAGETTATSAPTNIGNTLTENQQSFRTFKNTAGITNVRYTDKGFVPFIVEVRQGEAVRWKNDSNKALWVTSFGHPTAKDQFYPGFDEGKTIKRGESYDFVFLVKGVWGYKNLDHEEHLGAVVVDPQ